MPGKLDEHTENPGGKLRLSNAEMHWRGVFTLLIFALTIWWLFAVYLRLDDGIIKDAEQNSIDPYQRATNILLVVFPLLTAALGYWFGAQGKERAEEKAAKVERDSGQKVTDTEDQLRAVLSVSTNDVLRQAMHNYPESFKLPPKEK